MLKNESNERSEMALRLIKTTLVYERSDGYLVFMVKAEELKQVLSAKDSVHYFEDRESRRFIIQYAGTPVPPGTFTGGKSES